MSPRVAHLLIAAAIALAAMGAQAQAQDSSFDRLSLTDQGKARRLFEAQRLPPAGDPTPLTLDEVAALKDENGWFHAFAAMRARGLLPQESFGELMKSDPENRARPDGAQLVILTNGSGRIVAARAPAAPLAER